ncbi:hypothetical protein OH76DRAFT_1490024 [Lentinus brumalis]|uniref:Uncharacterized protein n=1 Tax=Lentinus brumalis TaxID=2498619 RepID=A0A371CKE0_9APHY|nr:hypothetical protein OH76DRAFT_1490024 [Polyporus brumalis]
MMEARNPWSSGPASVPGIGLGAQPMRAPPTETRLSQVKQCGRNSCSRVRHPVPAQLGANPGLRSTAVAPARVVGMSAEDRDEGTPARDHRRTPTKARACNVPDTQESDGKQRGRLSTGLGWSTARCVECMPPFALVRATPALR